LEPREGLPDTVWQIRRANKAEKNLVEINFIRGTGMLESFKKDFWLLSRENRGYFAWANQYKWQLYRSMKRGKRPCGMCDEPSEGRELVQTLFDNGLGVHPLFDIAFEAIARAEARLCMRFIPQRSNEERLTGHLISEIEAAINLAAPEFERLSQERYSAKQQLDFAYLDLSRGGRYEKLTGGDLGLIISVDLPDMPRVFQYVAIQAKKLHPDVSVNKDQFDSLIQNYDEAAAYMFYDMDLASLAPPMIINASDLKPQRDAKDVTDSFSISSSHVFSNGTPLSLWLMQQLASGRAGKHSYDLSQAIASFNHLPHLKSRIDGEYAMEISRLAMISIGKPFESRVINNESFSVILKS
jgi:hypothetical protein